MPQIAAAVVVAISYVGSATAAVVAGTATLAQIATVAAVGIGAGVGSMAAAKALTPEIGSQGAAVRWEANPDAPLRFAFGRVGVKGNIVDAAIYGPDRMYVSFACTVSAAGPIKNFVSFRAGDHYMSFDGAGAATNEPYRGEMWLSTRLGTQPDTALSLPSGLKNGVSFPGWNATRKMSGSAGYLVTLGENSKRSAYDGKIPAFVTTIEGLFCYDPRQDSTYPGGMGSCRLNDPTTWIWTQNPILFALKWALGLWEGPNGKGAPQIDYQVGGIGAKVESIRLTTVVEAANIADANGWTSAAWPSTDDDKAQVLDGFLKAAGARYAEIAGQIAFIHRAAPRAPVFTVRARDTAGPVEIDTASSKLNRFNTVRPRFWSEANEWEMTALPEVTATEWQIEDGQGVAVKRTRGADYTFVVDPKQTRELASLEISNSREGIRGRVPLRPYMDPEPGNTFIFDEPDFALSNLKCFVLDVEDDTENDTVVVTFETETDGKYPYAYGQTGSPPPAQELDPRDPFYVSPPGAGDWTVTVPGPAPDGSQLPNIDLTGLVSNDTADALLISWRAVASGENPNTPPLYLDPDGNVLPGWMDAGSYAPTIRSLTIQGPKSGAVVWLALRYRRGSNFSAAELKGPITVRTLVADVMPNAPGLSQIKADIEAAFGDIFDVSALVSQARTDIDAQGLEIAAARGGQPNLNSRIVQVNQARIDGDTSNAQAIALVQARTANTEADIIDLENALATETGARAEAIEQVTARQRAAPNLLPPIRTWPFFGGAWVDDNYPTLGDYTFSTAPGSFRYFDVPIEAGSPFVVSIEGASGDGSRVQVEYHGAGGYIADSGIDLRAFAWGQRVEAAFTAGTGLGITKVRVLLQNFSTASWARAMLQPGSISTGYREDAAVSDLGASVTEQSLAIIDLENQQALASWRVKAEATGGRPTILQLLSGSFGSSIAMTAEQIYFGDNTVFDDATDSIQTVWGSTRKVMAWGAPFGPDNLVEWTGPSSIALGSMTKANAGFWVDQVGAYGPTPLPSFWAKVTPTQISRSRTGAGAISTALNDVIVTCYTGTSGATCTWSRVSGDTTISYPSTGFTPVFNTTLAAGQTKTALFVGLVAKGGDVDLVYVNVEFSDNV